MNDNLKIDMRVRYPKDVVKKWIPLKQLERSPNKFYVKDRYGTEMLAFEFQGKATIMYPVGSFSKEQVNEAFEELRKLRETLDI